MGEIKNVNLKVASFAMKCVNDVKEHSKAGKYKTLVKKMSVLIQKNGLIGTLAFNLSKSKDFEHDKVIKQMIEWSVANYKIESLKIASGDTKPEEYINNIANLKQLEYRLVTKEMMNLFAWIKRFADGMIEGEDQNG